MLQAHFLYGDHRLAKQVELSRIILHLYLYLQILRPTVEYLNYLSTLQEQN